MTWGNNGAGPLGVPPIGPPASVNSPMVGQQGNAYPPFYAPTFESVLAAASRGAVSLNQVPAANIIGGVNNANNQQGNPTILQAMTQGAQQNGTNGLGVRSGPAPATEGTAAINIGSANAQAGANTDPGSTLVIDPRQMMNVPALASPIQYGGA